MTSINTMSEAFQAVQELAKSCRTIRSLIAAEKVSEACVMTSEVENLAYRLHYKFAHTEGINDKVKEQIKAWQFATSEVDRLSNTLWAMQQDTDGWWTIPNGQIESELNQQVANSIDFGWAARVFPASQGWAEVPK